MSPELDKLLCDRYPKIFTNRHGDMSTTAMCWGFECDDGWFNIIDQLCASIQSHIDMSERRREHALRNNQEAKDACPQVIAFQVKEKFGTLRFYISGGDDSVRGMIRMAEAMSSVTCEVCGTPGKTVGETWIRTLCETHAKEYGR